MSDGKPLQKWVPTTDLLQLRRLGKLIEECGELTTVAARCIIQGIGESNPETGQPNIEWLENELADVRAQIDCTIAALNLNREAINRRVLRKVGYMAEWEAMFKPPGGL